MITTENQNKLPVMNENSNLNDNLSSSELKTTDKKLPYCLADMQHQQHSSIVINLPDTDDKNSDSSKCFKEMKSKSTSSDLNNKNLPEQDKISIKECCSVSGVSVSPSQIRDSSSYQLLEALESMDKMEQFGLNRDCNLASNTCTSISNSAPIEGILVKGGKSLRSGVKFSEGDFSEGEKIKKSKISVQDPENSSGQFENTILDTNNVSSSESENLKSSGKDKCLISSLSSKYNLVVERKVKAETESSIDGGVSADKVIEEIECSKESYVNELAAKDEFTEENFTETELGSCCNTKNYVNKVPVGENVNSLKQEVESEVSLLRVFDYNLLWFNKLDEGLKRKLECIPEDIVKDFDWDKYLEQTRSLIVSPTAFNHVEFSMETGIVMDQLVEVLEKLSYTLEFSASPCKISKNKFLTCSNLKNFMADGENLNFTYWPARVIMACGSLIRLQYLCSTRDDDKFWCELSESKKLAPLGFGQANGLRISVPECLGNNKDLDRLKVMNEVDLLVEKGEGVEIDSFDENRREIYKRISPGDFLEVLNPLSRASQISGWIVCVKKNLGGRLLLQFVDSNGIGKGICFWLFFSHQVIKPLGWIHEQGKPWSYVPPASILNVEANLENFIQENKKLEKSWYRPPERHNARKGMYLEYCHEFTSVYVAFISSIIDDTYFEISTDRIAHRIVTIEEPCIFPVGYSKKLQLKVQFPGDMGSKCSDWEEFLSFKHSVAIPGENFPQFSSCGKEFEVGRKFEAANLSGMYAEPRLEVVTVEREYNGVLVVKCDSQADSICFAISSLSTELFPAGWANANEHCLVKPVNYHKGEEDYSLEMDSMNEKISNCVDSISRVSLISENPASMWCEKLYINPLCSLGPLLSKTKVLKVSQSIGPGPVYLVLREALLLTIGTGYIPTRVLRELQQMDQILVSDEWSEIEFKARYKRHTVAAKLSIPRTVANIQVFLESVCQILQCCPNFWASSQSTLDMCPFMCNAQNQLMGLNFYGRGLRRKRGSKKRLLLSSKNRAALPYGSNMDRIIDDDIDEENDADEEMEDGEDIPFPQQEVSWHSPLKRITEALDNSSSTYKKQRLMSMSDYTILFPNPESLRIAAASIESDPMDWSLEDVERYVLNQPDIKRHAALLKHHEIDGRAFLMLNFPSLIDHLHLVHSSAVMLSRHICKVKMAHILLHPT